MPPAIPSDQIQAEAVAWLIRLQRDQRGVGDNAAFRAWVAADPDHAVAFEAVSGTWDITGGLPRDMRGAVPVPPTSNRRRVMAGGVAMLAGASAITFWRSAEART
jgi:transmembrane sensor